MTTNSQQYVQPPPRPESPFFGRIRASGWVRADPKWVAGVCRGISLRSGWDVRLVRGLTVAAALLLWFPVALYGIAWLLLPFVPGGRIEAQAAIRGRFDWGQLWALVLVMIGVPTLPFVFGSPIFWWALVVTAVVLLIIYSSASKNVASPNVGQERTAPVASSGTNPYQTPSSSFSSSTPYQPAPQQAGSAGAPWQAGVQQLTPTPDAPTPDDRPKISNRVGFLTVGALFLIAALGVLIMFTSHRPVGVIVTVIGLIVAVTGAVLAWAALTGRRGGWFLGFSIGGAVLLLPVTGMWIGLGLMLEESGNSYIETDVAVEEIEMDEPEEVEEGGYAVLRDAAGWLGPEVTEVEAHGAQVVWDLTAPADSQPGDGQAWRRLDATGSQVTVLVTDALLPRVLFEGAGGFRGMSLDPNLSQKEVDSWVDSGFADVQTVEDKEFPLDLVLDQSQVEFLFLSADQAEELNASGQDKAAFLEALKREAQNPAASDQQSGN